MGRTRSLVGLALVGYGMLVAVGLVAHESLFAGVGSLLLGGALLLREGIPNVEVGRPSLTAGIGVVAIAGVTSYNLAMGSHLGLPEWGLLVYGVFLVIAAGHLDRAVGPTDVAALVGWSFPLLLGPLLLFSLDASIGGSAGPRLNSGAEPLIATFLVKPMAFGLQALGTSAQVYGTDLVVATETGSLTLGVGLVCAGLYPMVLFGGILGLHVWQTRPSLRDGSVYLFLGFAGLYVVNLLRLILLTKIGQRWGPLWLQTAHAHLGWILFGLFAALFWIAIAPRIDERPSAR